MTDPKRTAVYRFFDASGRLLYVGITYSIGSRFRDHERASAWWPEQSSVKVVWRETREEAAAEERLAIRAEKPLHNVQGTLAADERIRIAPERRQVDRAFLAAIALEARVEIARAGRSTREVSAVLGVCVPSTQARLRGAVGFRHGELEQLADFLGVPITTFFSRLEVSAA